MSATSRRTPLKNPSAQCSPNSAQCAQSAWPRIFSQANAKASEAASLAEAQKQQVITAEKVSLEKAKTEFEIQKLQAEAQVKRELMAEEFNYNVQLAQAKGVAELQKEQEIEDRKDERIRMQGTQQSELIDQRKNNLLPKNFESSGNDVMGGIGLDQFEPS